MSIDKLSKNLAFQILNEQGEKPQFESDHLSALQEILDERGVLYTVERVPANELTVIEGKGLEKEVVEEKVDRIENEGKAKPIVVSEDYDIIDGRHEARAIGEVQGEDHKAPVFRVHLPSAEATGMLNDIQSQINEQQENMDVVAVFSGRFQPFHRGHYKTYEHLVNRFGRNDTYIGTSDKVDPPRSPFTFRQKKKIITSLFDVPHENVVEVTNPYGPKEILDRYDPESTAYVAAVSEKDKGRLLGSGYFEQYPPEGEMQGYEDGGYVYTTPMAGFTFRGDEISGSRVRQTFRSEDIPEEEKKDFFRYIYGSFNEEVYNLMSKRLTEDVSLPDRFVKQFLKERGGSLKEKIKKIRAKAILTESTSATSLGAGIVDDGPTTWYSNMEDYENVTKDVATFFGFEVLDYITDRVDNDFKEDGLPYNVFYPAGIEPSGASEDPEDLYVPFIEAVSEVAGLEVLDYMGGLDQEHIRSMNHPNDETIADPLGNAQTGTEIGDGEIERSPDRVTDSRIDESASPDKEKYYISSKKNLKVARNKREIKNFGENARDVGGTAPSGAKRAFENGRRWAVVSTDGKSSNVQGLATVDRRGNVIDFQKSDISLQEGKSLISEGGGHGHMNHPFEDLDLHFGDLKNMINLAFDGELDIEEEPIEKVDGQNLLVSWKDGDLCAARNKGHLKNYGEDSMDLRGVVEKFDGYGEVQDAFEYAFRDLSIALSEVRDSKLQEIFENGKNWMSLEVIYPAAQNVVQYGDSFIVFHGIIEHDRDGNALNFDKNPAYRLADLVKKVDQKTQEEYKILSPPEVEIPDIELEDLRDELIGDVEDYMAEYDMENGNRVMDWHEEWWEEFIREKADEYDYDIPEHIVAGLIKRWAWGNKSGEDGYGLRTFKSEVEDEDFKDWADTFDKNDYKDQFKENIKPLEEVFLKLGGELLKRVETVLATDPSSTREDIKSQIQDVRAELEGAADQDKIEKLQKELARLQTAGGMDEIAALEGIVFQYDGDTYKLTGQFAPINQLIGIMKYG